MKAFIKYIICIILVAIFASCNDTKMIYPLNQSEIFFEETLASISQDTYDKDIFYIGTEDGIIYTFNADEQSTQRISTDFDRIYRVVRDTANIFWVGTRNMGLYRCKLVNNKLTPIEHNGRYGITPPKKRYKYSAYDILSTANDIFVATSHGLLKVPNESSANDSTLEIIAPTKYKATPKALSPFVVNNLWQDGKYVYAASDAGVIRVEPKTEVTKTFLSHLKIRNIVLRDNLIYAFSGDSLIVIDKDGNRSPKKDIKLEHPAQRYFYDEYQNVNYFIGDNSIQIVEDRSIKDPTGIKSAKLEHTIRTKCHNIIANAPAHSRSLLVTSNALIMVGHHQSAFNSAGNTTHICESDGKIYMLVDKDLYVLDNSKTKAKLIKHLDTASDIHFMEVLDRTLYYVDESSNIYKASLYKSRLANSLLSWDKLIEQDTEHKRVITSIGKDENSVYIGVRDGFRNIENLKEDIILFGQNGTDSIPVPYITRIHHTSNGNAALATLNDGIFIGKDNKFTRIVCSDTLQMIRDVHIAQDTVILTNRQWINGECHEARGYGRIFTIGDAVFGIKNFGITCFNDSTEFFSDIHFNPEACLDADSVTYIGSAYGAYALNKNFGKANDREKGYTHIQFEKKSYLPLWIGITIALTLIIFLFVLWKMHKHSAKIAIEYNQKLNSQIEELNKAKKEKHEDADKYIQDSTQAKETKKLHTISQQIESNSKYFEDIHLINKKSEAYRRVVEFLPFPELDSLKKNASKSGKTISPKVGIEHITKEWSTIFNDIKPQLEAFISERIPVCNSDASNNTAFKKIFQALETDFCNVKNSKTNIIDNVTKLPVLCNRLDSLLKLQELGKLLPEFAKAESRSEIKHAREKLLPVISDLIALIMEGADKSIFELLNIKYKKTKNGTQFTRTQLLAVKLTLTKIKVSRFANLFECDEHNIRQEWNTQLRPALIAQKNAFCNYAKENPSSLASLLIALSQSAEDELKRD